MPLRNEVFAFQPNDSIFDTSSSLRGVPSGFERSQARSPSKPTTPQINSANSRIVMSSPVPMLMISGMG